MYFNESQKTMYNLQMISKLVEIASSSNIFSHVHSVHHWKQDMSLNTKSVL